MNLPTGLLSAVGFITLIIGDEASLRMNGEVNTQNVREYAPRGNAPIFIMTETTVAQKSLSGLDYAGVLFSLHMETNTF